MSKVVPAPIFTNHIIFDREDFLLKTFHLHTNEHWFVLTKLSNKSRFRTRSAGHIIRYLVNEAEDTADLLEGLMLDVRVVGISNKFESAEWKSFSRFGQDIKGYYLELVVRGRIGEVRTEHVVRHDFEKSPPVSAPTTPSETKELHDELMSQYENLLLRAENIRVEMMALSKKML
jgi:hypothetical protein